MNNLQRGSAARSARVAHNHEVAGSNPAPATTYWTPQRIADTRDLAKWHETEGRNGTAVMIYSLIAEIELLREAAKGSLVIVNQAQADKNLATLRASTLLIVAEKIAPALDKLMDRNVGLGRNYENWPALQSLSDELDAAIRLVRG
ncbi:MAG: hypothetical protein JWP25_3573 [Bradyrhizobium sp.]|nr:hypothetical protein [Bradyrhizobium sp.]